MLEFNIKFDDKEFTSLAKRLTEGNISRILRSVTSRVRQSVIKATPVGDRPLKGRKRTKNQWTPIRKDEGGYSFENPAVQAPVLEYGSVSGKRPWPTPKMRTVYRKGRVYSSQAPEGITAKANVEKMVEDLAIELAEKLVKGESLAKG
jgi:hypothetical protein